MNMKTRLAATTALGSALLAAFLPFAVPARAAIPTGRAYIVHGIAGATVAISVDGKDVAPAAAPKSIVGPLTLDAGTHSVVLREGSRTIAQSRFTVTAGGSVDVVAHRRSDAQRTLSVTTFANDVGPVGPGKVRLAVAHVAAAPPADIKVDGSTLFRNVANGQALTVLVPAKTYSVAIYAATGAGPSILGPVDLSIRAGTLTRVFAIGDVTTNSMDAVVQAIPITVSGAAAPSSMPTGDGGQTADEIVRSGIGPLGLAGVAGAGLIVAAGGTRLARRRLHGR